MKRPAILLILSLVLLGLTRPAVVYADTCDLVYDFAGEGDQLGWAIQAWHITLSQDIGGGTWTGAGFQSEYIPDYSTLLIYIDLESPINITDVDVYFYRGWTGGSVGHYGVAAYESDACFGCATLNDNGFGLDSGAIGNDMTSFGIGADGVTRVWFAERKLDFSYQEFDITKVVIHYTGSCAPSGYTRPYRTADEDTLFDTTSLHLPSALNTVWTPAAGGQVQAVANAPGVPVMAAEGGTITQVTTVVPSDCSGGISSILSTVAGGRGICAFMLNDTAFPDNVGIYAMANPDTVYVVDIAGDDGNNFEYIVANATNYIQNDMTVNAGCVIGEAAQIVFVTPSWLDTAWKILESLVTGGISSFIYPDRHYDGLGISLIRFDDTTVVTDILWPTTDPVLSQLTEYNEAAQPCNLAPGLQDCLNSNPDFRRNGEGWTLNGEATYGTSGGVILEPGTSIDQQLNLDPETEYSVTVHAAWVFDTDFGARVPRSMRVRIGTDTENFTTGTTGDIETFTIASATHAPDVADTFWTIRIQNTGRYSLYVQDACVSSAAMHTTPQACYFANSTFDNPGAGWDSSSAAVNFLPGFVTLPDSESISQNVTLTAGDYTLVIFARAVGDWDGSGEAPEATLYYTFPADTGTPAGVGLDPGYNLPGHVGYPGDFQEFDITFTVDEDTTGDFELSAQITGAGVDSIAIDSACLSGADNGGGIIGPPTPQCKTAARPQTENISEWFTWSWHNLDQFYNCTLMVLLNKMYNLGLQSYRTMGFSIKWTQAVIRAGLDWSDTNLFPFLAGHFRNMATGQVTTITSEAGCHDVFCTIVEVVNTLASSLTPVINALANAINSLVSILVTGASFFFTVAAGLVAFIVAIVTKIITFLLSILALFHTIIDAYNTASPASIPGLPTCTLDPSSSLLCAFVWVADNTIFSGRWGILITMVLAILSFHLLLWAIGEIKNTVLQMGGAG